MKLFGILLFIIFMLPITICNSAIPVNTGEEICGKWITAKKDLIVEVVKVNNLFSAKIIGFAMNGKRRNMNEFFDEKNPNKELRSRKWLGLQVVSDLKYKGKNKYENGTIYEVKTGKTYRASAILENSNRIEVRGYLGFELIGKTLIFNRYIK